jgi:hypothetical protein
LCAVTQQRQTRHYTTLDPTYASREIPREIPQTRHYTTLDPTYASPNLNQTYRELNPASGELNPPYYDPKLHQDSSNSNHGNRNASLPRDETFETVHEIGNASLKVLRAALATHPYSASLRVHLAREQRDVEEEQGVKAMESEARRLFESAVELAPHSPMALVSFAEWLERTCTNPRTAVLPLYHQALLQIREIREMRQRTCMGRSAEALVEPATQEEGQVQEGLLQEEARVCAREVEEEEEEEEEDIEENVCARELEEEVSRIGAETSRLLLYVEAQLLIRLAALGASLPPATMISASSVHSSVDSSGYNSDAGHVRRVGGEGIGGGGGGGWGGGEVEGKLLSDARAICMLLHQEMMERVGGAGGLEEGEGETGRGGIEDGWRWVTKLDPENGYGWAGLASEGERMGVRERNNTAVEEAWMHAVRLLPYQHAWTSSWARAITVSLPDSADAGEKNRALEKLRHAQQLSPNNGIVLVALSEFLTHEEALEMLETAHSLAHILKSTLSSGFTSHNRF